jgi:hypothetical protein
MLINKFKFRRDIQSYNLGGMGCSIGVVAIGLVRDMLQVSPGWQDSARDEQGTSRCSSFPLYKHVHAVECVE